MIALIALTFINCTYAQFKLEITPSDSKYAKMQIDCEDQADCDKKLLKWIEKQQFFKGVWSDEQVGSLISKQELDLEGQETTVYFQPSNFSATINYITQELADKEAKKLAKQALRDKLNKEKKDLTLKEINELLRD